MPTVTSDGQISRGLHAFVWIVQILLAMAFLWVGGLKLLQPLPELERTMVWVAAVPEWFVRCIGVAEILGAVGLILPALACILPFLTRWAAACLAFVTLCAAIFHAARLEFMMMLLPGILCLLLIFVVWGRSKVETPLIDKLR